MERNHQNERVEMLNQVIIPLFCGVCALLFPMWLSITIAIVLTLFFDSIALLVVAWLIAFQNQNATILYVLGWIAGALITYIILSYVQKTFIR